MTEVAFNVEGHKLTDQVACKYFAWTVDEALQHNTLQLTVSGAGTMITVVFGT